jgi:CheY-like chemotaxis protein
MSHEAQKRRVLVIDDSEAIHTDFRRVLCPPKRERQEELDRLELLLFGEAIVSPAPVEPEFEVDSAFQGQEGVSKVKEALAAGQPYALTFLDYRMPPGWNGIETLRQLRKVAPSLQVVIFSAYADYSWEQIIQELGTSEQLAQLRKPFSTTEVRQLVRSLTEPRQPALRH